MKKIIPKNKRNKVFLIVLVMAILGFSYAYLAAKSDNLTAIPTPIHTSVSLDNQVNLKTQLYCNIGLKQWDYFSYACNNPGVVNTLKIQSAGVNSQYVRLCNDSDFVCQNNIKLQYNTLQYITIAHDYYGRFYYENNMHMMPPNYEKCDGGNSYMYLGSKCE